MIAEQEWSVNMISLGTERLSFTEISEILASETSLTGKVSKEFLDGIAKALAAAPAPSRIKSASNEVVDEKKKQLAR